MDVNEQVWRRFWNGLRDEWERRLEPSLDAVLRVQGELDEAGRLSGEELRAALRKSYGTVITCWQGEVREVGRQGELGVGRGRYQRR